METEHLSATPLKIVPLPCTAQWKHEESSKQKWVVTAKWPGLGMKPAKPNLVFTNSAMSFPWHFWKSLVFPQNKDIRTNAL